MTWFLLPVYVVIVSLLAYSAGVGKGRVVRHDTDRFRWYFALPFWALGCFCLREVVRGVQQEHGNAYAILMLCISVIAFLRGYVWGADLERFAHEE